MIMQGNITIRAALLVLASVVVLAPAGRAQYHGSFYDRPGFESSGKVEDIIDIQLVENELIGVVAGRQGYTIELDRSEKIVWRRTRGAVGAVLTESRILALSGASHGWAELPLKLREAGSVASITALISDHLALFVTSRRIIGFDSRRGRWVEQAVPIHEQIVDSHINSYVAAVVTGKRLFAWAAGRIDFREKKLRRNEAIRSVETRSHTITVRTDRRVLVFRSGSGGWREL